MGILTVHDLADSTFVVGVECTYCLHRALIAREQLRAKKGDMRTLADAGVRCGRCGSREFSVERMVSRSKAHAFLRNL